MSLLSRPLAPAPTHLILLVAVAVLAAPSTATAQDVTPPVLVSYAVSPATADATSGPATVTISASITDDLSGFDQAVIAYEPADTSSQIVATLLPADLVSGDLLDGGYETTIQVPQFSRSGTWSVASFTLQDATTNAAAIPAPPASAFGVISNEDLSAPTLALVSGSTGPFDVTAAPGDVSVTLAASDDVSGVDQITVTYRSPSGSQTAAATLDANDRISGDALNGVYEGVVQIPTGSEPGSWEVSSVVLTDFFGTVANLSGGGLPSVPTVVIYYEPPLMVSYVASPSTVDVTSGPIDITFTAHFTDIASGFAQADILYFPPDFSSLTRITFVPADLVSGDPFDGTYEATISMPQYSRSGTWSVFSFRMEDDDGNVAVLDPATLPSTARFDVVSVPDLAPPGLTSIFSQPASVDVTTGARSLNVTIVATDDVSGVASIEVTFESPSGDESASATFDASDLAWGDALDGGYQGAVAISHYAEAGTWTVSNVQLVDGFGYLTDLSTGSIPGGAPSVTVTRSPDTGNPQVLWLQIDPHPVDLAAGATSTTFRARLVDTVSGITNGGVVIQSPTNLGNKSASFSPANRISGSSLDGIYEDTVDFALGDPLGGWVLQVVANDAAGNGLLVSGGGIPGPSTMSLINSGEPPPPPSNLPSIGPGGLGLLMAVLAGVGALAGRQRELRE